jgi:hypothetical protein
MSLAQQEVVPLPGDSTAAQLQQINTHQDPSAAASAEQLSGDSPFRWGSFVLSPHFLYRFLYGTGIQSSPGHSSLTAIQSFAPGFSLGAGSFWMIDYTPTWDVYSSRAFKDTLGQAVSLMGARTYKDWTVRFTQGYVYSSQPLVETGAQTQEQVYSTALQVTHQAFSHVVVETDLDQDLQYATGFPSTSEWSGTDKIRYIFSQHTELAVGMTLGFVSESEGSDEGYFRPVAELTWRPTDKISLDVTGGAEHREFFGDPWTCLNTPIFELGAHYFPFDSTKWTLSAGREIAAALFENQITKTTHWNLSVEQRLLGHFFLTGTVGYTQVAYIPTGGGADGARNDDGLSYSARLRTTLRKRTTISILYQHNGNVSTLPGFGFESDQVGAEYEVRY